MDIHGIGCGEVVSHDLHLVPYLASELGSVGPIFLFEGVLNRNDEIRVDDLLVESDELVSRQQIRYNSDRGGGERGQRGGGEPHPLPQIPIKFTKYLHFPQFVFSFLSTSSSSFSTGTFSMPPLPPFLSSR